MIWYSPIITLFACCMSRHRQVFPDDFGTTTIGLSQVVGPTNFNSGSKNSSCNGKSDWYG